MPDETVADGTTTGQPADTQETAQVEPEKQSESPEAVTKESVRAWIAEEVEKARQEGYKQSQRVIANKDRRILELETQATTNTEVNVGIPEMESVVKALKASGGDEAAISEAERSLNQAKAKVAQAAQMSYQQKTINENKARFDKMIEDSGIDPEDERLNNFDTAFEVAKATGNFTVPDKALQRILKAVKPATNTETKVTETKPKPQTISDTDIQKRIDEGIRAELVRRGLVKGDAGAATGGAHGRRPTLEELRATPAEVVVTKYSSGEWAK